MNKRFRQFLILAFCLIIAYFPVLFAAKTANPDAHLILGNIESMKGIGDYLSKLFSFQTIDFQPIRDLSLSIDLFIYRTFNFNTFIWQNLILWGACCWVVFKILNIIFAEQSDEKNFMFALGFSLYPLFCSVLSWGMARKHILAFFFILLATFEIIKSDRKSSLRLSLWYLLSLLSQPIGILWPVWAMIYSKKDWKKILPSISILLLVGIVNYFYYEKSPVFLAVFQSKTNNALNIPDKVLAFGHYIYQLFVPYYQTFFYDLGHWSVWAGIGIAAVFYLFYSGMKFPKKELLLWSLFGLLPLAVVLNTPDTKSDTYLIQPALGLLILVVIMLKNFHGRKFLSLCIGLLAFWVIFINRESALWTDLFTFSYKRNFLRRPSCVSAVMAARAEFTQGKLPPTQVQRYIGNSHCVRLSTDAERLDTIVLHTNMIYYGHLSSEKKIQLLDKAKFLSWYAKLALSAQYFSMSDDKNGLKQIHELLQYLGYEKSPETYIPFVADTIIPACERLKDDRCVRFASLFSRKKIQPYL